MTTQRPTLDDVLRGARGAPAADVSSLAAAARAELQRAPVAKPWWRDALVLVGVNLAAVVVSLLLLKPVESAGDPLVRFGTAAVLLAVVTAGGVVAIRPGTRGVRVGFVVASLVAAVVAIVGGDGFDPGKPFWRGLSCAVTECLVSIPTMAVALVVLSRFASSLTHVVTGGVAAIGASVLMLHFHCPNGTVAHLAVFHVLPWLVLVSLVVLARQRMPTKSYAP